MVWQRGLFLSVIGQGFRQISTFPTFMFIIEGKCGRSVLGMERLEKLMSEYLEYCRQRKNLNGKTLKAYRIDLTQYAGFIESIGGDGLQRHSIDTYITEIHKHYKPRTIKRKTASLKAFFHYLVYIEVIGDNPFNKIDISFREPKLLPKTIPLHTIQIFLSALYGQKAEMKTEYQEKCLLRDIAVCELLFATGMRISELCSLLAGDIDLNNGNIRIYGKGAKERMIQVGHRDVLHALSQYRAAFFDEIMSSGYFFVNRLHRQLSDQSVRFMINKYVALADIPLHITPHMFRHSFATLLLEQDVDIRYIQRMLGHSSITTTEIYTHVSSSKQKDILVNRHPRNQIEINEG